VGVDWELWRVLSSPRFSVSSPGEILYGWSLEDLHDAHAVLDMYEELDRLSHARQ
jgi:hypothetical protein